MNKTILEQIEIDKTHIDDFPLETEEGTKRAKEKFYEKAVIERNQYVNPVFAYQDDHIIVFEY